MYSHEVTSFKGYGLNQKPVIFGKINPLVLFPFAGLFVFTYTPIWLFLLFIIGMIIVFDLVGMTASEAIRSFNLTFIKRSRVVYSSTPTSTRLKNMERFGL
jgi:hypothetical protein